MKPTKLKLSFADLRVSSFTVPAGAAGRGTVRAMSGDPKLCIPETIDTTFPSLPQSNPDMCVPPSRIEICLPDVG